MFQLHTETGEHLQSLLDPQYITVTQPNNINYYFLNQLQGIESYSGENRKNTSILINNQVQLRRIVRYASLYQNVHHLPLL